MTINLASAVPVKTKPTKVPCAIKPAESSAVVRFPCSIPLWRRAVSIPVALFIVTLCVHIASAQTALMNGTNAAGTLLVNTTNSYTFIANAGDNVVLRLGTTGFYGDLNLYGPNGALLKTAVSGTDAELDYTATNSGTFTARVSSYASGGTGMYVLHLAQFPEA